MSSATIEPLPDVVIVIHEPPDIYYMAAIAVEVCEDCGEPIKEWEDYPSGLTLVRCRNRHVHLVDYGPVELTLGHPPTGDDDEPEDDNGIGGSD